MVQPAQPLQSPSSRLSVSRWAFVVVLLASAHRLHQVLLLQATLQLLCWQLLPQQPSVRLACLLVLLQPPHSFVYRSSYSLRTTSPRCLPPATWPRLRLKRCKPIS